MLEPTFLGVRVFPSRAPMLAGGGNTPCVQVTAEGNHVVIDAGTASAPGPEAPSQDVRESHFDQPSALTISRAFPTSSRSTNRRSRFHSIRG